MKPAPFIGTPSPLLLVPMTGMPPVYHSRSAELNYDVLQTNPRFVPNPYGPQLLILSRSNHRW
jgi:hypothetical protein